MKNYTSILIVTIISIFIVLGCSSSGTTPTTNDSTSVENKSKPDTNSGSPTSSSGDPAGSYTVNGTNPGGGSYEGTLTVTKRDSVYQFSWNVAGSEYEGVGVQSGNAMAVAYTTGKDGSGCGAVIYEIIETGKIRGKWGAWGVNQSGTENGVQTVGNGFLGGFEISGTNGDGTPYKGKLLIKKETEEVYQLAWSAGKITVGTGIKLGNYLAAGSGDKRCGFVIYEVNSNNLNGKWGVPGTNTLGTEKAVRK